MSWRPSPWARAALLTLAVLGVATTQTRFQDPVGERYVQALRPGGADFVSPFMGTRALLRGLNPYWNDAQDLRDPWQREVRMEGYMSTQAYPPTHLLMYVPLALVTGGQPRPASRLWFDLNLFFLLGLALATVGLLQAFVGRTVAHPLGLAALCLALYGLHPGLQLGLERGQSDVFTSLLAWCAVLALLRGRLVASLFLATAATLMKGYALVLLLALFALAVRDRARLRAAAGGAVAAVAVLLLPVAHYLPHAVERSWRRVVGTSVHTMFMASWMNHGFQGVMRSLLGPDLQRPAALALTLLALASAAAWCLLARREEPARPRATIVCATLSLAVMALAAPLAYVYDAALYLPGLLVLVLGQDRLADELGLGLRGRAALGTTLALAGALAWLCSVSVVLALEDSWGELPLSGYAVLLLVLASATLAPLAWVRRETRA